ncbi:MAG TPA: ABC transporter ATP-binding protein, partial [Gaiellaceae bacterium]|nr:ABC transporter ATP-binding protein [Gaiellaceae bacterium]
MAGEEDETGSPHLRRGTFVRLLSFLRPYRASLALSTILAVASQIAGILVPVLTGVVIDELAGGRDTDRLTLLIAAIVALGLVRGVLMLGRRLISGRQALGVEYDLRDELYAHFLRLSFGFYDRSQTGQLMSRATIDLQSVRFFLGYGLIFFAQHVLTVVVVTIVLFVYSWQLALVALAVTPVIVLTAHRYSRVSHPVLRDVQQKLADVATVAEESITGVHVVKSFSQEDRLRERFARAADAVFDRTLAANRQRALYVPLLTFLPLLAQAAVLLVAGRMVVSGSLTIGDFFAFNLLLAMLVMPLRMLGMWIGQAQRAMAAGERIFEILDEPEQVADRPDARPLPPGQGHVRFEGVDFGYEPGRPVLEGIDLEIAPGRR